MKIIKIIIILIIYFLFFFKYVILLYEGLQTLSTGQQTKANPAAHVCNPGGVCKPKVLVSRPTQTQACGFAPNAGFYKPQARRPGLLPRRAGVLPRRAGLQTLDAQVCRPAHLGLQPGARVWPQSPRHDSPSTRFLQPYHAPAKSKMTIFSLTISSMPNTF